MAADKDFSLEGACTRGAVRYRLTSRCSSTAEQPWVVLAHDTPALAEYYERDKYWPKESLERRRNLLASARSK